MVGPAHNVPFLCSGTCARSIFAEAELLDAIRKTPLEPR